MVLQRNAMKLTSERDTDGTAAENEGQNKT